MKDFVQATTVPEFCSQMTRRSIV